MAAVSRFPSTMAILVLFLSWLVWQPAGCVLGAVCRSDQSCPSGSLCRGGECIQRSLLGENGNACRGGFDCLSQTCVKQTCVAKPTVEPPTERRRETIPDASAPPPEILPEPQPEPQPDFPQCNGFRCGPSLLQFGGTANDTPHILKVDPLGAIYMAGRYDGSALFGKQNLKGYGREDAFLVKLSPKGNDIWGFTIGGIYDDGIVDLAFDSKGNVYVTGFFHYYMFGPKGEVESRGRQLDRTAGQSGRYDFDADIFVAKVSPGGTLLWVRRCGGHLLSDGVVSIVVDDNDHIYVAGQYRTTGDFGTSTLTPAGTLPQKSWDIFISKLDTNGNWLWTKSAGGTREDVPSKLLYVGGDTFYLVGLSASTVSSGPLLLPAPIGVEGRYDAFVARMDKEGRFVWGKRFGGKENEHVYDALPTKDGSLLVLGVFSNEATFGSFTLKATGAHYFLAKLDTKGTPAWATILPGESAIHYAKLAIDANQQVWLTGGVRKETKIQGSLIGTDGKQNTILASIDNQGHINKLYLVGDSSKHLPVSMQFLSNGTLAVLGTFEGVLTLPQTQSHNALSIKSIGLHDIFLMLLTP